MQSSAAARRPLTDVVGAIFDNIQNLLRTEARLITTELKEQAARVARPIARIAAAVALGFYGLGLFLVTAVILLSRYVAVWQSAAILGTLVCVLAAGLLIMGRRDLKRSPFTSDPTALSRGRTEIGIQ